MIDADRELVGSVHDSEVGRKYVDGECLSGEWGLN